MNILADNGNFNVTLTAQSPQDESHIHSYSTAGPNTTMSPNTSTVWLTVLHTIQAIATQPSRPQKSEYAYTNYRSDHCFCSVQIYVKESVT